MPTDHTALTWSAPERDERFRALFVSHHDAVAAYIRRRSSEDADDVLDETFLVAWRRLEEIPEASLPWLLGVARRMLANQRRTSRRHQALIERMWHLHEPSAYMPIESAGGDGEVLEALRTLSARDQEALALVAWEELEPAEAARSLNCSRTAFAMRLKRARRRFTRALERIEVSDSSPRMKEMLVHANAEEQP